MKKQMVAERTRRADFIHSEGNKAAARLTAEGSKMVSVNMGIAQQEATRKKSEGESGAKVELARAESIALETVAAAIKADGSSHTDYLLAEKYLELVRLTASSSVGSTIYFPYKISGLTGLVSRLPSVFGAGVPGQKLKTPVKATKSDPSHKTKDDFSELN